MNPLLQRSSPIHDNVFSEIKNLHADYVRFVPWYPYPRLTVAELSPPASGQTSWDFTLIDPIVEDFETATRGHSSILNFSTTPVWMWQAWQIVSGQLYFKGGGSADGISQAGASWTDYTFAADVTPLQTGSSGGTTFAQAGMLVRMNDDGTDGYAFLLSNLAYTSPAASGYIVFVKLTAGVPATIEPVALPFAVTGGTSYHVTVTASGTTLTAAVNGTAAATFTDSAYTAGRVGFREGTGESAYFGNVTVTAPDGTLLLADDFAGDLSQWNPFPVPDDPSVSVNGYAEGGTLAVPVQTVADYYRRLVSWYTAGGFTDENGNVHRSGHHYPVSYWEVLNEPSAEHSLSAQSYTQLYDAIVTAIREVSPHTKFVGLALGDPGDLAYISYFLDPANHEPGVPVDMISYHFYADPAASDGPDQYGPDTFAQADSFFAAVASVEAVRKQLAPHVRTTVDECGTILPEDELQASPAPIPDAYWNYSGCMFAYVFANLALLGIDVVGESQMVGFPAQFPSVSMVDWNTGLPNARYRVLQLLIQEMRPGCTLVPLASGAAPDTFFGLGLIAGHGGRQHRKLLLVSKTSSDAVIQVAGLAGARAQIVDQDSAGGPARTQTLDGDSFTLGGYAVAVLTLPR